MIPVKCRKCRTQLFDYPDVILQDSHGIKILDKNGSESANSLPTCVSDDVFYIPEETKPGWISDILQKQGWEKGKINCPNCGARIGSYNFVSGNKCQCEEHHVLPPLHLVKSKVDFTTPWNSSSIQELVSTQLQSTS